MVKRSWLASLYARLAPSSTQSTRRRRRSVAKQFHTPAMQVEFLESRQMLTPAIGGLETTALLYGAFNGTPNKELAVTTSASLTDNAQGATNLSGLVVQISSGYKPGRDSLNFDDFGNITHVWDAATGTLTLSGSDTIANYNTAIKAITYQYLDDSATTTLATGQRFLSFKALGAGTGVSPTVKRELDIVDATPLVSIGDNLDYTDHTGTTYPLTFNPPINLAFTNIIEADPSVTTLTSATVRIINPATGFVGAGGQDVLKFTPTGNIIASYNPSTGVLTASGSDTIANYISFLKSITYQNVANGTDAAHPSQEMYVPFEYGSRQITFTIVGPTGTSTGTKNMSVGTFVDPPVISNVSPFSESYIYTNGQTQTVLPISTSISTNVSSSSLARGLYFGYLESATIQISGGTYQAGEDQLVFTNTPTIGGTWDASTGTLTLSGVDTLDNYTAALRSVGYLNLSFNPSPAQRQVTFNITDYRGQTNWNGSPNASPPYNNVIQRIVMVPVDNTPVLSGLEQLPINYQVHTTPPPNTPVNVSATILAEDKNRTQLSKVVISFTSASQQNTYVAGEDQLLFTNTAKISGTWNATAGTLTLTGLATLAEYTAAIRSVQYTNLTTGSPTLTNRVISFTPYNDLGTDGKTVYRTIIMVPVVLNGTPQVSAGIGVTAYVDHTGDTYPLIFNPPVNIGFNTITAPDPTLSGATVSIVNNTTGVVAAGSQDLLAFTTVGNIQATYDPATGILTATGTDTLANYITFLKSITYQNVANGTTALPMQPMPVPIELGTRAVTFKVTAASGVGVGSTTIGVKTTTNPPVITGVPTVSQSYVYNNGKTQTVQTITPTISVSVNSDVTPFYSAFLESATVQITGNYKSGEDQLVFNSTGTIGASWDAATGTLTLSGVDTLANYTKALASVGYLNLSTTPSPLKRSITFNVTDWNGNTNWNGAPNPSPYNNVVQTIVMVPSSTPSVLSGIETSTLAYTDHTVGTGSPIQQGVPVTNKTQVTNTINVTDTGNINLESATIKISVNYKATEDVLLFTDTAKIHGDWDPASGTLTLTGVDTLANYVAALRSIRYTNLAYDNGTLPSLAKRTVTFTVTNQSDVVSNTIQRDIQIIHGDNPPSVSVNATTPLSYVEKSTAQAIAPALTVADNDTATLSSATIKFTTPIRAEDVLSFVSDPTTMGNIAFQSFSNGVLKLVSAGATATLAQWQAALRTVGYSNTSNNPNLAKRTVSFTITDALGLNSNDVATRDIVIIPVNDAPILSGIETTPLAWLENGANPASTANNVTPITATLTAADSDSVQMSGATIVISKMYQSNEDVLGFVDTATIKGTWDAATGTLTLAGTDTLANYQAALRAVTYTDTSGAPKTATRTVSFTLTDIGGATSNTLSRSITITLANDRPILSGVETTPISYTENVVSFISVPVTATLAVTDVDSSQIKSATVSISTGFQAGQDVLTFTKSGNISGSYNASTGVLTFTGVDTLAMYQTVLRSVRYQNTSHNPSAVARQITFVATDTGNLPSFAVTRSLTVNPTNNAPTMTSVLTSLAYTEGSGAKPINAAINVSDLDNTTLASATITITNYVAAEDVLGFVANAGTMGNIAISSNANGILTLTSAGATATFAQWSAALRAVTYTNTSGNLNPVARNVTFTVNDGKAVNSQSNVVSTTINIAAVFPPTVTGTSSLAYIEKNSPTAINTVITVASASTTTLSKATITITNFVSGQDVLGFVGSGASGNIFIQSNTGGVLTLVSTGATATIAQWQAALRAVTYFNSSANPNTTSRNVTFQVDSGKAVNGLSNKVTSTVSITAVNDPSVVTNPDTTPAAYTEDAPGVAVFPNLTVSDVDSSNLTGAMVRIIGNYNALGAVDKLLFTNTAKITGTFNTTTGTLTLTGTDTVANYQAALRSVKFTNSFDLSAPQRTVSLTVTDDTAQTSNPVTRAINITTVNNAPILSGVETTAQVYKYNDPYSPPPAITTSISITDYDSTLMQGAVVKITTNYDANKERLGLDISGTSLTASWNAATGQLSINGVDTIANYTKVLRTVAYINLGTGNFSPRTITFSVTDNTNVTSNVVSRNLNFVSTNVTPTLAVNTTAALNYIENSPATPIAPGMTVADPDSPLIQSATIKISSNYVLNEDKLVFTTMGNIKGTFAPGTGTLVLTGADTLANYQAALQAVQYFNTSHNPSTATRTITFTVTDGLAASAAVTRNITVRAVNDAPIITTTTAALAYQPANGAVAVDSGITVTDPDNTTLTGATVQIVSNYQRGKDVLAFVNTIAGSTITGSFDSNTGILTLTGTDTVSNYRAALTAVTYKFVGTATTQTKVVSFVATDGTTPSNAVTRSINVTP